MYYMYVLFGGKVSLLIKNKKCNSFIILLLESKNQYQDTKTLKKEKIDYLNT